MRIQLLSALLLAVGCVSACGSEATPAPVAAAVAPATDAIPAAAV